MLIAWLMLGISANGQLKLGEWNIHLPYYEGVEVTQSPNKIYCASKMGLFSFDKQDRSVEVMTKITGLSDVGISTINYNSFTNSLLVAYSNSNLDVLTNEGIINLPDIKNKIMTGDKQVYRVFFHQSKAYLACGFGIVVLDMQDLEFADTWMIGPEGGKIKICDFTVFDEYFYAATEKGLYRIDTANAFPANYANWEQIQVLETDEKILEVETVKNDLYLVHQSTTGNQIILRKNTTGWEIPAFTPESDYTRIIGQDSLLITIRSQVLESFLPTGFRPYIVYNYSFGAPAMRSALVDEAGDYWIADANYGLIRSAEPWANEAIMPNGPYRESAFDIDISDNKVYVAGGGKDPSFTQIYSNAGIYKYANREWTNYNRELDENYPSWTWDMTEIIVDPTDSKRIFAGSWGCGLLEFYEDQLVTIHNDSNSSLQSIFAGNYVRIGGMAYDQDHNLWVSNAKVNHVLSCYTADKEWIGMPYGEVANADQAGKILIDQNNYKWVVLPKGDGLFILDDAGTPGIFSDDRTKKLTVRNEEGEVVNDVFSIAEDQDGIIWVGTNQGILLYYNSWSVFNVSNYYGNRIIVNLDGTPQVLLGTETINDIAIDGANRKWLATQSGGVFLMSADGRTQVAAYNVSNSPLLSNTVYSIGVNHLSGEVFFGTDKGISSLLSEATAAQSEFGKLLVYPNPVRPEYEGDVVIKGVVQNTLAYITDISGNMVFSSAAYGGQVVWDRKDFSGREVAPGVYLVFCANDDGSKSAVTKLLIVN